MSKTILVTILSCLLLQTASAQLEFESPEDRELARARASLEALQTEFGQFDPRMLEPLEQFSRQLMEAERFDEVQVVLDQASQIVRIRDGLYASNQYPYLAARAEAYAQDGDWRQAREIMDHMTWLMSRPETVIDENLLENLDTMAQLHLLGVASDSRMYQRYHFRQADRLSDLAIRASAGGWGLRDRRIVDIIYRKIQRLFYQAEIVDKGGATALNLRRYSDGGLTRSRSDTLATLYYSGLQQFSNLRAAYAGRTQESTVPLAFVEIYQGDWFVLFNDPQSAALAYQRGYELLRQADISPQAINRYFSQPKMLPVTEFVDSWEAAMASLQDPGQDTAGSRFSFKQWSLQFPEAMDPDSRWLGDENPEDYAMFSFSLAGLEEVRRWYRGRLKRSTSAPQDLELLQRNFEQSIDLEELEDTIQDFRFRPRLVDGVPQSTSATLYYQLAEY